MKLAVFSSLALLVALAVGSANAEGGSLRASSSNTNTDTLVTLALPSPYTDVDSYLMDLIPGSINNEVHQDEDGNGERKLSSPPSGCSSNAIPGVCSDCNGNGCSAFRCSAFTNWKCPAGYSYCGYESCVFTCPDKLWCDPN